MWQTMHCEEGMARVNSWRMGWPGRFFAMVGSELADSPALPYFA